MNTKQKSKYLSVFPVVTLILNIFMIHSASAITNIYVDPSTCIFYTDTTSVGDHFTISLRVTDIIDLYAWQVKLYFDSTQIEVVAAWVPTNDSTYVFYGRTTWTSVTVEAGYVFISDIITEGPAFNGSGLLGKIEFEILMAPPPDGTLSSDLDIDNEDTKLLDSASDEIPTTKTNGFYQYIWVQPYRDIAIINMTAPETACQGEVVNFAVTLENQGDLTENFILYVTFCVSLNLTLAPKTSTTINYSVDTSDIAEGNYTLWGYVLPCFGDQDPCDNMYTDGIIQVIAGILDIAITEVAPSKTVVAQGYCAHINVTVENQGGYPETFNVTTYYDDTAIKTRTVTNLPSGEQKTITFTWNTTGVAKGNYTMKAIAEPVLGETDTTDNTLADGWIIVAMVGDITGGTANPWEFVPDGKVGGIDLTIVARCFGSWPEAQPPMIWHPNCDIDNDQRVSGVDLTIVAKNFGKVDP